MASGRRVLRDFLRRQSAVTDLIGERLYAGDLPVKGRRAASQYRAYAIVLRAQGGILDDTMNPWTDTRVDVMCFGPDYDEAEDLAVIVAYAIKSGWPSATASDGMRDIEITDGGRVVARGVAMPYYVEHRTDEEPA